MMTMRGNAGFTLIELLLVVTIIGILAAMVVPNLSGRAREARITAAKGDITTIGNALDRYELRHGEYPKSLDPLVFGDGKFTYLKGNKRPLDPWKNEYVYLCPGKNNKDGYDLSSRGPDGTQGGGDDITSWD